MVTVMCNAWNHSDGCTCGFGGEGHSGSRSSGLYPNDPNRPSWYYSPYLHGNDESFVNPNAKCPVCGVAVFYYRSPYGGSVFFDELGPPWPKHPCTDNSSIPEPITASERTQLGSDESEYEWQRKEWEPYKIFSVMDYPAINGKKIENSFVCILGWYGGSIVSLYCRKEQGGYNMSHKSLVSDGTLVFVRKGTGERYELSLYSVEGARGIVVAFDSIEIAVKRLQVPNKKTGGAGEVLPFRKGLDN